MPHFFAARDGARVEIRGADARHLARALRARPGERISVVEPEGRLLGVRLVEVDPALVVGLVEEEREHHPEPEREIVLAVALLPAAALDLVLSRGTEVGASGFVLVAAERSVSRGARPERWAAICREATMLAGRLRVPQVRGPVLFEEAWAAAVNPLLLDRSGPALTRLDTPATLFVGPEGGWSPEELKRAGERVASLGPRNLRAETAALVGLTLALGAQCP